MHRPPFRYFMLHKPYGMVSQFVSSNSKELLGGINFKFPEGIHAIGRLDKQSEGLLLLTTNKKITALLFQSKVPHERTYLVQVRQKVDAATLRALQEGVSIKIEEGRMYTTPPCRVSIVEGPTNLFPPPYAISPFIETTWLQITLTEGKFRQVRKMVAAVRHRCLRLIRVSIEDLKLGALQPGQVQELEEAAFFGLLKLESFSTS